MAPVAVLLHLLCVASSLAAPLQPQNESEAYIEPTGPDCEALVDKNVTGKKKLESPPLRLSATPAPSVAPTGPPRVARSGLSNPCPFGSSQPVVCGIHEGELRWLADRNTAVQTCCNFSAPLMEPRDCAWNGECVRSFTKEGGKWLPVNFPGDLTDFKYTFYDSGCADKALAEVQSNQVPAWTARSHPYGHLTFTQEDLFISNFRIPKPDASYSEVFSGCGTRLGYRENLNVEGMAPQWQYVLNAVCLAGPSPSNEIEEWERRRKADADCKDRGICGDKDKEGPLVPSGPVSNSQFGEREKTIEMDKLKNTVQGYIGVTPTPEPEKRKRGGPKL